jgi:redox-sensing transcriptional repressor
MRETELVEGIPEVVILRLPIYARTLATLSYEGRELVSSQELGERLHVTPAQIRKDLSYFGRFGKQGRGYNVRRLLQEVRQILGLDREWTMALIGVGSLGRAILGYSGFAPEGFRVAAAFDMDPAQVGRRIGSLVVQQVSELGDTVQRLGIRIGIVAVPATAAQRVVDILVKAGVRAILNYAPADLHVPSDVMVREIDPVAALQSLTYYLKSQPTEARRPVQTTLAATGLFRSEP